MASIKKYQYSRTPIRYPQHSTIHAISGPFAVQYGGHFRSGIISGPIWGSFADLYRSSLYPKCSKCSKSIFSLFLSFLRFTEAAVETNETRLYKDLFKNYNKYTHPVIDESRPVKIVFDFQLIRIIDVVSHTAWKFSSLSNPCALMNDLAGLNKRHKRNFPF